MATAAHALLPTLPGTSYYGVDADASRLSRAAQLLAHTEYADRVVLVRGRAERLPWRDSTADVALSSMTLQHIEDLPAALAEIRRILRLDGRFVAMEPDNLANLFYFDGLLPDVNAAFRALFAARREAHRPADCAVGPSVPRKLEAAGFSVLECRPYLLGRMSRLTAGEFFEGARRVAATVSASARSPSEGSALRQCNAAVDAALAEVGSETVGHGCHLVPVFVSVAQKGRLRVLS